MSVTICKSEIPDFLKKSDFYQNLNDNAKDDDFSLDEKYYYTNLNITANEELISLVNTLHFWGVE